MWLPPVQEPAGHHNTASGPAKQRRGLMTAASEHCSMVHTTCGCGSPADSSGSVCETCWAAQSPAPCGPCGCFAPARSPGSCCCRLPLEPALRQAACSRRERLLADSHCCSGPKCAQLGFQQASSPWHSARPSLCAALQVYACFRGAP